MNYNGCDHATVANPSHFYCRSPVYRTYLCETSVYQWKNTSLALTGTTEKTDCHTVKPEKNMTTKFHENALKQFSR